MLKKTAAAGTLAAAFLALAITSASASAKEAEIFLSHSSGFYDNTQYVSVINADDNDVYYTTDGTKPDNSSKLYDGSPVEVSENTVIRIAVYSGDEPDEPITSDKASIKIRTAQPSASQEGGEFTEALTVELSCSDPDAAVYYTTDGTVPTKESKKYKKAIEISKTTTLKFAAFSPDKSRSRVVTEKYVISENQFDDPLCQTLFELVNETRAEYGLDPLKAHDSLTSAAEIRAKEYSSYQSHYRPDGSRWDTILSEYGLKRDVRCENLAYYYTTAKAAMKCWMSDPYHRGNILNPDAEYIGLACYDNGWCCYWCQLFIGGE